MLIPASGLCPMVAEHTGKAVGGTHKDCLPGPWVSTGAPGHLPKGGRQVPTLPSTAWESLLSHWLWQLL